MSRVIRISESIFQRLQELAVPLVDTPASVIERLIDYYDSRQGRTGAGIEQSHGELKKDSTDSLRKPSFAKDPSTRSPRERGAEVEVDGQRFRADSLADLYRQVLRFVCDNGHIERLKSHLPVPTSRKRYLIASDPVHPGGRGFVAPVEHNGYYMEAHKDYKNGINHLRKMLKLCGLSLTYLG